MKEENCIPTIGTVVARSTDEPGPAPGITYTIRINLPNGTVQDVAGTRPAYSPWYDLYGLDVRPLAIGSPFEAYVLGRNIKWYAVELVALWNCDGTPVLPVAGVLANG